MSRRGARGAEIRSRLRGEREENPVWSRNRPGKGERGRSWIFYGSVGSAWVLVLVVLGIPVPITWRMIPELVVVFTLLQCAGGYALASGLAGFGSRPWELEELSLTQLTFDEIVYGIFDTGIRWAFWLYFPLQIVEILLLGDDVVGLHVIVILATPIQLVVLCRVLQLAVQDRSRMRLLPSGDSVVAFVWALAIAGGILLTLGFVVGSFLAAWSSAGLYSSTFGPVIMLAAPGVFAYCIGIPYLDEAHANAVANYEDYLNGDREKAGFF